MRRLLSSPFSTRWLSLSAQFNRAEPPALITPDRLAGSFHPDARPIGPPMTEPEKSNIRHLAEAVAREKRMPVPRLVALPEPEDNSWRDILADFERRFQQAKAEEAER